jgi:hypothetical protein
MQNTYESPEVIEIGQAPSVILGEKKLGMWDSLTQSEGTEVINLQTDIDE